MLIQVVEHALLYFVQQQVVQSHTTHIPHPAHIYVALVISNVLLLLWGRESSSPLALIASRCRRHHCQRFKIQIMDLLHLSGGKFVENMADLLRKDCRSLSVYSDVCMKRSHVESHTALTRWSTSVCVLEHSLTQEARSFVPYG